MSGLGAQPLAAAFRAGIDDPVSALQRCLKAAERGKDDKAILWRVPSAEADAAAAAQRQKSGTLRGVLDGVPVVVKDCIDVAGTPSTIGTRFLLTPKDVDSEVVRRLRAAGAVVFAKTNMHELGCQPTGINPHHGTPVNPWDPARIPGGSSAGSAVAVASGIAPLAIGTDAGGSVRVPAAFNGLVGFKPTFGAVPTDGVARLTEDLDHVGPIAWTVDDARVAFEVIAGRTLPEVRELGRVGILVDWFGADEEWDRAVRKAIAEVFVAAGEAASPVARWAAQIEFVLVGMQSSRVCGELLRDHPGELGADARTILQLGLGMPDEFRQRAMRAREALRAEFAALFGRFDLLVAPAVGAPAPKIHPGARGSGELDTVAMARFAAVTFPANLAGLPCCAVPCSRDGGPVSLQILGRANDDARVLAAARKVEERFGPRQPPRWHGQS